MKGPFSNWWHVSGTTSCYLHCYGYVRRDGVARSMAAQDFWLNGSYFNPFKQKRNIRLITATSISTAPPRETPVARGQHFGPFALLTETKSFLLSLGCLRCDLTPSTLQFRLKFSWKHKCKMTWMQTVLYSKVSLYQDLHVFIIDELLLKSIFVNLDAHIEKQKTFEGERSPVWAQWNSVSQRMDPCRTCPLQV